MAQRIEMLTQDVDQLKKSIELIKGSTWIAWASDLIHHALWGVELSTLFKVGVAIASAPTMRVFLLPYLTSMH